MRNFTFIFSLLMISFLSYSQSISDTFEGNGNITTWIEDNCGMDTNYTNPIQNTVNPSAKVLRYNDTGGQYANVRFDTSTNFDLSFNAVFTLKIYVPSSSITGNQSNQISLKLQNNTLTEPWSTQTEIVKPIVLNQWQTVTFNFATDTFVNLNAGSPNPTYRNDLNRVLIQINGENNNSFVTAYIDDFLYNFTNLPVYDNLVWSDEFNGNGAIDATKWHHQTLFIAGNNWANGEVQHYTNRIENSFQANGNLNIVAKKETFFDQGQTRQHTSARLNSKFAFQYGKVEVRAKMPTGIGTWPAIWMLGRNITENGGFWANTYGTTGWPACGEIDIMEHWGNNQNFVQSAMHTPSSFGNTFNKGGRVIPTVSSEFHVYSLEWSPQLMIFKVDGIIHYIYNPTVKNASTWPFDASQYLLLNIAIEPGISANFVQSSMEVDYLRVYQEAPLSTKSNEKSAFQIYPNPANNLVTINTSSEIKEKTIYDLQGKLVKTISNNSKEISLSDLSNGIYILKISGENGEISNQKLFKN